MLTYELDAKNSRSLYEQLYQAIRSDIELARLDAGSKLPSKRTLAQHLGISVITVESAYRQLAAEGYIEAKERRGYFVNELPSVQAHDMSAGSERIEHQLNAEAAARQIDPVRLSVSSVPSIQATPLLADFSGNDRSGDEFPFHIWAKRSDARSARLRKVCFFELRTTTVGQKNCALRSFSIWLTFAGWRLRPSRSSSELGRRTFTGC